MFKLLKRLFSPSTFDDEVQDHIAKQLHYILIIGIPIAAILPPISLLFGENNVSAALISGSLTLIMIGLYSALKLKYLNLVKITMIGSSYIGVIISLALHGGIRDIALFTLPLLLILTSVFWGGKATVGLGAATVIVVLLLFWAEHMGLIYRDEPNPPTVDTLLIIIVTIILTTVYLRLTVNQIIEQAALLKKGNQQLQKTHAALEQRTQELSALSLQLEDIVEDRTKALKEAQEQLVRQEKLVALGELAGSVGHELRNPLGVINNAIYYLQMVPSDIDETGQEYLDLIKTRTQEMDRIVADLLHLRIRQPEKEAIQILALITQVIERQPPPKGIKVNTEIIPDLPPILVDPQQIGQVLTNLVTNAYQAMPEGGELTFTAHRRFEQLSLSVTDTGIGMSSIVVEQVFEPLFTTKAKGIGLGLSLSKNLVEINGGLISVKSDEGQGSTFTLILPMTDEIVKVDETG